MNVCRWHGCEYQFSLIVRMTSQSRSWSSVTRQGWQIDLIELLGTPCLSSSSVDYHLRKLRACTSNPFPVSLALFLLRRRRRRSRSLRVLLSLLSLSCDAIAAHWPIDERLSSVDVFSHWLSARIGERERRRKEREREKKRRESFILSRNDLLEQTSPWKTNKIHRFRRN